MKPNLKILSVLSLVLIVLNVASVTMFSLAYYSDRDSFEDMFCVNQDKPELQCHGQCHLKKIAQETNEEDKEYRMPLTSVYNWSEFLWLFVGYTNETDSYLTFDEKIVHSYLVDNWSPPWCV